MGASSQADYTRADRDCDIVMKGGVTSGIVYPGAVCRLAETYRFRSIGGTSAGAIAAGATAAAEFGRRNGHPAAFRELEGLPRLLGEKDGSRRSLLMRLFRPDEPTRRAFETLFAALRGPRAGAFAAARHYFLFGLLGAASFVAIAAVVGYLERGRALPVTVTIVLCLLLSFVGFAAGVGFALVSDLKRRIPENGYGLCSGMGASDALTPWLYDLYQRLAGKDRSLPLTFGDLSEGGSAKSIDLLVMTTNVTHSRPYTIPLGARDEQRFFFKESDFRRLFPKEVVDWMVKNSPTRPNGARKDEFLKLPPSEKLPIIVGVRMSLSFPLLISAVPLYAIDYERGPGEGRTPEVCWFSDGGISSNFPVHFFDSPLPSRPTFAVNLRYLDSDPDPAEAVVMAEKNNSGVAEWFKRLRPGIGGFVGAVFESMQNWQDNAQTRLPGWRDRIVHVCLGPGQGGVNLDMPAPLIETLSRRGDEAGRRLANRFTGRDERSELDWENHRWVRFRSTLAMLEETFEKLAKRLDPADSLPTPGDKPYRELLEREVAALPSYRWTNEDQRRWAREATKDLYELCAKWTASRERLRSEAPAPLPELRPRPRV